MTNAERCRLWRERHPERQQASSRAWRSRNIESERSRMRERGQERRRVLAVYKLTVGCTDCGYRDDADALDFDHVRGEKTRGISRLSSASLTVLIAELEKCEVVCSNCHRQRTKQRRQAA